ncbi:MAG: EamA family transporter [Candidatus Paceibacterota bacterium]
MAWIIPLFVLVILEAVADIVSKTWQLRGGWWMAGLALFTYLLANTFWLISLKNGAGLGKGAVLFSILSAVLAVIIGVIFYKENIATIQLIGLILGIISLVFIFWE